MYALHSERDREHLNREVIPASFFCPISHELMKDPVIVVETGQTYERSRIEQWLKDNARDPLTNQQLHKRNLTPNIALRDTIEDFKKTHVVRESLTGRIDMSNVVLNNYQRNQVKQTFKVSLLGAPCVGKTSLIRKIIYDQFNSDVSSTVGVDIETVTVTLGGRIVKLVFWDTAGQEQFNSMTFTHIRGSHAILTVYDLSRPRETLACAQKHLLTAPVEDALVFLIGNKADLVHEERKRKEAVLMGQKFADRNSMLLFETSAKNSKNVKRLIISLVRSLLALHKVHSRQQSAESIQLETGDPVAEDEQPCSARLCLI